MYAGSGDMFGSGGWRELYVLDRLLAQLTRPALPEAGVPPLLREQLRDLGVPLRRNAGREELIAEVWGRKRPLMHRLSDLDDPMPPCA
jgi:hypothetical protein